MLIFYGIRGEVDKKITDYVDTGRVAKIVFVLC